MFFHSISATSNASAEGAIGSAVSSATSAFGKESRSIHLILVNIIKTADGWKAVMKVVVEPDLSVHTEARQHPTLHHDEDLTFTPDFVTDDDDIPLDILLELSLEKRRTSQVNALEPLSCTTNKGLVSERIVPWKKSQQLASSSTLTHERNKVTPSISPKEKAESFIANNIVKNSPIHTLRKKTPAPDKPTTIPRLFTYIHIPPSYQGLYLSLSALTAEDKRTYVHLLETHLWSRIIDYLLDIPFYEATHRATFDKERVSDSKGGLNKDLNARTHLKMEEPKFILKER